MTDQLHTPRLLRIDDLRRAIGILFDAAEERFGEVIDLDERPGPISWYWTLSADASYEVTKRPRRRDLTMGDLDDDLLETAELLSGEDDRGVILWHDLAHLCGLLGALTYLDLRRTTGGE